MQKIRFTLHGLLMGLEFKDRSNIEVEAKKILVDNKSFVEKVTEATVVNKEFLDMILETSVRDGELDGHVERHVGYEYTLEKVIPDSLEKMDILKLIFNTNLELERRLSSKVDAINAECELTEDDLDEMVYEYEII